ncbi:Olfactory receptor 5B12, partial [Heterocephalus glaber]
NRTEVTQFLLLGLTDDPHLQVPLFITLLVMYTITVAGNLGMILLILLDPHLHTPMYYFLGNLSLVDFGYSSAVTPMVMAGLLTRDQIISYNSCASQMFFFVAFATVESFLLASMAYDRYAAVCKPLHYTTNMTTNVCSCLITGSYICGFLNASIHTGDTFRLSFCKNNVVHHFFCDIPAVMVLSCSDRHVSIFGSQITLMENSTEVTQLLLLGLTDDPHLQVPLFFTFLLIYTITVAGNLGMLLLILLDRHLHTSMYYFLANLSLVDFGYSSAVTPTVMAGLLTGDQVISYDACAAQLFLFVAFATVENYLL